MPCIPSRYDVILRASLQKEYIPSGKGSFFQLNGWLAAQHGAPRPLCAWGLGPRGRNSLINYCNIQMQMKKLNNYVQKEGYKIIIGIKSSDIIISIIYNARRQVFDSNNASITYVSMSYE